MSLHGSQIPYLSRTSGCNALRWDILTGCDNPSEICAVKGRALCWAECKAWRTGDPDFAPAFHPELLPCIGRLHRPRNIAVGFGGDMWSPGVDIEWKMQTWRIERLYPRNNYIHLTKCARAVGTPWYLPPRIWMGISVCNQGDASQIHIIQNVQRHTTRVLHAKRWISFEPILGPLLPEIGWFIDISFVVIGGLSDGNGRIIPPDEGGTRAEWIDPLIQQVHNAGVPCYLKNLRRDVLRQITNPRTGRPFETMNEMRDLPKEWLALK